MLHGTSVERVVMLWGTKWEVTRDKRGGIILVLRAMKVTLRGSISIGISN